MPAIRRVINEVEDKTKESQPESETDLGDPPASQKQLSDEDDAKYAAVIDFCGRLSQLGEMKRGEFRRAGIEFVFEQLLRQHPRAATHERLHLIWFVMGTSFTKVNSTCRRVVRDIDYATAKAILKDESESRDFRSELDYLLESSKEKKGVDRRIKQLQRLIAGKAKIVQAEARKVDLLYGLLYHKKKTHCRRAKKMEIREARSGVEVGSPVGKSVWDTEVIACSKRQLTGL